ncbi:hypothetical protein AYO38_10790 [bacterium SCGC AG-212-C10]|nr:hypothetical protein AYO38_10790 [bacterium SCGC AG-212-C10]
MTMQLFDSHAHIQDDAFRGEARSVVERARRAGVIGILACGYDAPSNLDSLSLAAEYDIVYPAVGFHPHEASTVTPDMLAVLEEQALREDVLAVGEIGLDFYRDHSPHDVQRVVLDAQLELAARVGKPVSVHTRGAEDAIKDHLLAYAARSPLRAAGRPVGVLHCFGGTVEQAMPMVEAGFLVSLACAVTYPRNDETRRMAAELPLDVLLVETDSPYLPPQRMRGKRNEPSLVGSAVEAIAGLRKMSTLRVAETTTANALRLLAIPIPEPAVPA